MLIMAMCPSYFLVGTVTVRPGHQAIEGVIEFSQARLEQLSRDCCVPGQYLANVFAFFMQTVPDNPIFAADGNLS
jgi:hypothetical protein